MRKRLSNTLWGILLIVIGIAIAGKVTGIWEFSFFFDGWWTLCLIVPAFFGIVAHGIRICNTVALFLGVALLTCCQGYLSWELLYRLMLPLVMIVIGMVFVLKSLFHFGGRRVQIPKEMRWEQSSIFSGKNVVVQDTFFGMDGDAIFGGLTIDLRQAVISEDICINVMAVFGGVDLLLPAGVSVKLSDTSLFGGCTNHRKASVAAGPIVYVNAVALFGGVELS